MDAAVMSAHRDRPLEDDAMASSNRRFELRDLGSMKWAVVDLGAPETDPRRIVACVYEVDEFECDVFWYRDLSLPMRFGTPDEVLDAIVRSSSRPHRIPSRRPVPIPVVPLSGRLSA
jgi:hypothetical protein